MSWIGWTRIISIIILIIWILCYHYLIGIKYGKNKYGYVDKDSKEGRIEERPRFAKWILILCILSIYVPVINIIMCLVSPGIMLFNGYNSKFDVLEFRVIEGDKFSETWAKIIKWLKEGI